MIKIPILLYHSIASEHELAQEEYKRGQVYAVKPGEFEKQIKYLLDKGYRAVSFNDYIASIMKYRDIPETEKQITCPDLPDKSVIITFDDGHYTNYTRAFPILQRHGIPATFFITIKNAGSPLGVQYANLKEMAAHGMSIQSHTMTHRFLSDLSHHEIRRELQESKSVLEERLGLPVDYLSLPGGRSNAAVKDIAREVGYKAVCTSVIGFNDLNSDPYSIKRWALRKDMTLSNFASILQMKQWFYIYHGTRYFLLAALKRMIGNQRYEVVRDRLL